MKKVKTQQLPRSLSLIARIGGFIVGKERIPGTEVMWRGLTRLGDMVLGWSLLNSS
jgi:hypothetical protein